MTQRPELMPSQADHVQVVKLLLEAKADIDAKANNGATALIMASSEGHSDIVRLLLEAKADVNAQGQEWKYGIACCFTEGPHQRRGTTQNVRSPGMIFNIINQNIWENNYAQIFNNRVRSRTADPGDFFLFSCLCGSGSGSHIRGHKKVT